MDNQNNNPAQQTPVQPQPIPVVPAPPPTQPKPFHLTLFNKISIFLVALILLGLGGYFFLSNSQNTPSQIKTTPPLAQSPTPSQIPTPQSPGPADPTGLTFTCDIANKQATLSWNDVPKTDFYHVHVKGETQIDTRVYSTSHTIAAEPGKKYSWWIEAVNHNADFTKSFPSQSVGGPEIRC